MNSFQTVCMTYWTGHNVCVYVLINVVTKGTRLIIILFFNCYPALPSHDECKLEGCSRPCYVDLNTGVQYDCCSKRHGIQFDAMKQQELLNSGKTQASSGKTGCMHVLLMHVVCNAHTPLAR